VKHVHAAMRPSSGLRPGTPHGMLPFVAVSRDLS
jgi:hypothetical protein